VSESNLDIVEATPAIDPGSIAVDLPEAGLSIEGISEPVISHYFERMNAADYQGAASLFAEDGILYPPFESPIVGQEAIAAFLEAEARGMQLQPRQGLSQSMETGEKHLKVTGKVQTPLFGVNTDWFFVLNPTAQILSVNIKLLASPHELLNLKK
jgi:Nuclear transport factor 2 (NTF2) domain